ncbi:MAG TPA: hypothetical protein VJ485_04625 [archaeon]|nr:hypothetical protein [archaeon]
MRKTILKTFTVMWLLGMYIVLIWTFMAAYASPQKAVRVMIDNYNEANMEFFMLAGSFVMSLAGTFYIIGDIKKDYFSRVVERLEEEVRPRLLSRSED